MREVLALLIPAGAIGVFMLPFPLRRGRSFVSAVTLSICLGIGFSSIVSIALIALGVAAGTDRFALIDAAIWASVAALGWWVRGRMAPAADFQLPTSARSEPWDWFLRVAFGATAMIALLSALTSSRVAPHGDWDAWAIWNQHARFLFYGGSETWRALFAINWSQPDYPMLLPASVARVWAYAGHESTLGPSLIAIVFGIASVTLVVMAIDGRRGWIAGALILGANTFLAQVPSQCADIPLACFIVATLAVACGDVLRGSDARIPAVVAGAASAMAAWTKNEGLVFALLMLIVAIIVAVRRRNGRLLLWSVAGASPAVIALAWFKLALAPSSGLLAGLSPDLVVTRLFDLHRHATVAVLMAQHALRWSAPLAAAVLPLVMLAAAWMAVRRGGAVRVMAVVLALMLASYYLVYVTTPFDVVWHISSSVDRLLVQLWPSLVLTAFWTGGSTKQDRPAVFK
jgi:hypothetical protein